MQDRQGHRVSTTAPVFDRPPQRRNLRDPVIVCQESSQLQFRVQPFFDATVDLQTQAIVIANCAVGMLRVAQRRRQRFIGCAA